MILKICRQIENAAGVHVLLIFQPYLMGSTHFITRKGQVDSKYRNGITTGNH